MNRIRRLNLALCVFLLPLTGAAADQWYSSCDSEAFLTSFELDSRLELRRDLLPAGEKREELLRAAMLQQVRYHQKSVEERWALDHLQVVIEKDEPEVSAQGESEGKSQADYEISPINHPDVKIEIPYLENALKKGRLEHGEPILSLRFHARWKAMVCGHVSPERLASSKATAPLDPYLAFWTAPASERRLIRWENSEFVISPVFDSEYADIPDPFYGWYFWRPDAEGTDKAGKAYKAADYLRMEENTVEANVKAERISPAPPLRLVHAKPKKVLATIIFGVVEPKKDVWDLNQTFKLRSGTQKDWAAIDPELRRIQSRTTSDNGSKFATDFLANISHFLDKKKFQYRYDPKTLVLTLQGHLKKSGRAIRLRLFFGPTDLLVQEPPKHWKLAADSLRTEDLFIYLGHAGLGENFKPANIEKFSGRALVQKPGQILAILSCYSFSYFSDFDRTQQVLFTGSAYRGAGVPVGLFTWFDAFYENPEATVPWVAPSDFLLLRSKVSKP